MPINCNKFSLSRIFDEPAYSKRSITTIGMEFKNSFSMLSRNIIRSLDIEIKSTNAQLSAIKEQIKDINESETCSYNEISDLYGDMAQFDLQIELLESQKALCTETEIINLFRSIEISIKKIINIAYDNVNTSDLYKWDSMITFFKAKDIDIKKIPSYAAVNELRIINNDLKHQGEISIIAKRIAEFKSSSNYTYENLSAFSNRIQSAPSKFLIELGKGVIADRFEYTDIKLETMAENYRKIMDTATIEKFAQILSEK